MEPILDELRATFESGIWYPVIAVSLMMPDACGAVEFWGSDKSSRKRYIEWYDAWILPQSPSDSIKFDGSVAYRLRNALMHESTGFVRGVDGFDRVIFFPPTNGGPKFDWIITGDGVQETALGVSIENFMNSMVNAVGNWLVQVRSDPDDRRLRALERLLQLHPMGIAPHYGGISVVA